MHVRNVRADGEVNRNRDFLLVGGHEHAHVGVLGLEDAAQEILTRGFAVAHPDTMSELGDIVYSRALFPSHAELAFTEGRLHIFRSSANHRNFEIVDEGGTVHGNPANKAVW